MNSSLASTIADYQSQINTHLDSVLANQVVNDPKLLAAMRHGLLLGGKRVRPLLVYLVGQLNKAPKDILNAAAAAVECIHAYSLIHDDLPAMDDDELRRGQPTCHIAYDEATAILAGDALQSLAFSLIAEAPASDAQKVAMLKILSQAAGYNGMCGGQALDIAATNQQVSLEQLERVHQHKTGAIIKAAVMLGAVCSKIEQANEQQALARYADALGLAFQVRDDILDIISDTDTLGKPQGSDQALNKSTYPSLLGLEGAIEKAENLGKEALQALESLPYNSELLALLADYVVHRNN
ncbi:(2E,6E)-farnesyl diphosphate synthase [Agarivorans sp. B2Z047]|uniref:(2E,6E)-farnesyl diphosphate synthase n=1 Tax=Agarivorans sp. B2Z047 TaxID=2652721 RepID=UPI00140634E9|nr:(2E,6E)-farnesyl diphosphate synthase [Agarivorans sp. B2Z047]MPW29110.1 (2E,6E)-farnesyl diphosphate synthase [Agarivorans sp. B2Z047]UQN41663.1 (2E,6E)-farnesyl diphosphate synthase [Agarivorans sp. B2Z047]